MRKQRRNNAKMIFAKIVFWEVLWGNERFDISIPKEYLTRDKNKTFYMFPLQPTVVTGSARPTPITVLELF